MQNKLDAACPEILECTLRDGSYALDFQFTFEDTKLIAGALDHAGFEYIEVGHGVGLGASEAGFGKASASDEQYMLAAAEVVRENKWGMFCIPGVANLAKIQMAASYGMNFVRIGTNIDSVPSSADYIEKAKSSGMTVFANFMKSYTQLPAYFARAAAESVQYGADAIYLVDSAGGMLPEDVRAYIRAAQDVTPEVKLGFHGHNNLGLAMANALVCMEEGVSIIDTSLQGFGRSAGNVSTELFLGLLVRMGLVSEAKLIEAMDIGEQLIQPRITQRGLNSLDVTAGVAQFHSSYMVGILSKSREKGVDPRMLILELCRTNKLDAPDAMVERLANQLAANSVNAKGRSTREWGSYYGDEEKKI